jgi:hypothetical protein
MDPKNLFADERLMDFCVFCGGNTESRYHCPSKILLDEPYPTDLPVVDACESCNSGFSSDELYLACFIECVISGSTAPDGVRREKLKRHLRDKPALAARIDACRKTDEKGGLIWQPEMERVRTVLLKLARGHIAYELSLPKLGEPARISFAPLAMLSEESRQQFESTDNVVGESPAAAPCPELGSRAFLRAWGEWPAGSDDGWINVQRDRYRYLGLAECANRGLAA